MKLICMGVFGFGRTIWTGSAWWEEGIAGVSDRGQVWGARAEWGPR